MSDVLLSHWRLIFEENFFFLEVIYAKVECC